MNAKSSAGEPFVGTSHRSRRTAAQAISPAVASSDKPYSIGHMTREGFEFYFWRGTWRLAPAESASVTAATRRSLSQRHQRLFKWAVREKV